jgi:hypothetical protein
MNTGATPFQVAAGIVAVWGVTLGTSYGQGLLNESGSSLLAPSIAPTGGHASNPQEYLSVGWSVVENASDIYTYSYTLQNPAGDVILNSSGGLTATPEIYNGFSVNFDTTLTGAYLPGTQTGGVFQQANTVGLSWFFNPSVSAGSTGPTVTFQSDLAPTLTSASANGPVPWSSLLPSGQEVPAPGLSLSVPEPSTFGLMAMTGLVALRFRKNPRATR